ncbi:hypothetical protein BCR43DRAFT_335553 [Syncephalastrum racemosum]|uniref:Uncharacterized protein n=1 Tax=Syncephalastrum racemosum TaxID=13706 RepID=A0A1X2H8I8_SYNRA|nr:hypothetical protein BCR43DRAFT_335553 [Syncephalastrum racemosum]
MFYSQVYHKMVRQDLEEHEDGHESTPVATAEEEEEGYSSPVPPSERFTEDYDRSYPPQLRRTPPDTHPHDTSSSTSSSSWARKGSVDRGTGRRASEGRPQRHFSGDRRPRTYSQRRLSQENHRAAFQPTVLQRPRRPSSVTSDPHQPQPAQANANDPASQREVMLTAAERAKARRDAEEAEFEAARERARKKAEALAALAKKDETEKVSADDKASPKDKLQSTEKASPEDRTASVEKAASVEKTAPEDIPSQDKVPSVEEVSPEDKAPSEDKTPSEDKAASEDKSLPGDSVSPEKEVQSVDKVLVEEETSSEDKTKPEDKVASDDTVGVSSTAAPVHPTATQAEPSPSPPIGTPVESHNERQPQDKTEDEDDKAWRDYVENVGKTAPTAADTKPASGGASAWNAYAGRLHQKEEDKWSAAVKKYAEERNMDPEVFEDLRPYVPPSTRLLHRAPPSQQQQQQQRGGRPAFSGGHAQRSHDRRTSRSDHPRLDHRRSSATSTTASIPTPSEPAEAEPRRRRSPSSKATERQKVLSPSTEESSHAESLQETSVHRRRSPSSRTTERRKVPSPSTGESSSRFESLRKLPTVTPHDEPVWADLVCLRKAQRQAALRGASRPVFPAAVDRAASTLAGRHFCFTSSPSLGGGLTRDSTPPPPPSALPVLAFPIGGTTPPISPGVWSAVVAMASAPPSSQLPSGVPAT